MKTIKQELKQRNFWIYYSKNFSLHDKEQFTSNFKKTIDKVWRDGVILIEKMDGMFWGDVDFVMDLTNYIMDSHLYFKNLEQQTDIEFIGDFTNVMQNQTELFLKIIEEHTINKDNLDIIKVCTCNLCVPPENFN